MDRNGCSLSRRAGDVHPSAEGVDPVSQTEKPRAPRWVGSAEAVVANRQPNVAVEGLDLYGDDRCLPVLGHVGEGLGDHVVDGYLNWLRQAGWQLQVDLDGDRRPAGEGLEGRTEPTPGQHGGVDAMGQLTQFVEDILELPGDPADVGV